MNWLCKLFGHKIRHSGDILYCERCGWAKHNPTSPPAGVTDHDELTGVSPDDHHAQDHETRHESGGADAIPAGSLNPQPPEGWELIGEEEVGTATDYVEFTGLDGDADEMYKMVQLIKNDGATGETLDCWVNGDYFDAEHLREGGTYDGSTFSQAGNGLSVSNGFDIGYANSGGWEFNEVIIHAESGRPRASLSSHLRSDAGLSYAEENEQLMDWWFDTTTVIDSLRILRGDEGTAGDVVADGIGAGSRLYLFKKTG